MLPDTLLLPPPNLRFMREDDALFMRIANENVALLEEQFGFTANASILDIGSGYGRLAYGILSRHRFRGNYVGLDILPAQVHWCRKISVRDFRSFASTSLMYVTIAIIQMVPMRWKDSVSIVGCDVRFLQPFQRFYAYV